MSLYLIDLYLIEDYEGGCLIKRMPDYGYIQIPSNRFTVYTESNRHSDDFVTITDTNDNIIGAIFRNRIVADPSWFGKKGLYAIITQEIEDSE